MDVPKVARLQKFHFSTIQGYILEMGEEYIRFYKDYGQILSGVSAYEIATTYQAEHIFELKFTQSADVMYITHPSYPPKQLTRTGHTSWTLTNFVAKIGDEMTVTGITQANPAVVTCTTVATSLANGDIVYISGVTGMDTLNDGFYEVAAVVTGAAGNFQLVGINSTSYPAYGGSGTVQECQFGTTDNCPSCVTFFEQRLAFAGTNDNPQRFWLSTSADYDNFTQDASDDDAAIEFTLVSDRVDRIRWILGQEYLIAGTTGGVWRIGASSAGDPLTATNITAKKQVSIGVKDMEPEMVSDAMLWATRSGRILRQLIYSWEQDKWVAPDMTRIARHITMGDSLANSGIVDMDFQMEPQPILWAVRADGELLGLTYEIQEQVYAWFRIVTDGEFESVAVLNEDDNEDQVWVIVKRTINGTEKRYVEYFKPHEFFSQIKDCFFVHSGLTYDGGDAVNITNITPANPPVVTAAGHEFKNGDKVRIKDVVGMTEVNIGITKAYTVAGVVPDVSFKLSGIDATGWTAYLSGGTAQKVTNTVSNLDHLEGETVDILIDGAVHAQETVSSGAISLDWYGNLIHVGLPYTSTVEPMKLHAGAQLGTARGKKQKITSITACFYETRGGKYGPDSDNLKQIPWGTGAQPTLKTEDVELPFEGDWGTDATICIVQDQPLPITVLGIVPEVVLNER